MNLVRDFLHGSPHIDLVVCGELIFFTIFVGAALWVFRKGSAGFYDHLANIPLEKDGASHD
ncbi:MAG: cbb3-type cytochrome oxidase subunit 3 [Bdellovibrionota bacterium]